MGKKQYSLTAVIVLVIFLWVSSWYLITEFVADWPDRGTFGDMFGAVNSLFSGLAFAVLIYALFLQKEELKLQREDLKLTRGELQSQTQQLSGQKEQMERQSKIQTLQMTDNTFFNYVQYYYKVKDNIFYGKAEGSGGGFQRLAKRYQQDPMQEKTIYTESTRWLAGYYSYLLEVFRFIDEIDAGTVKHKDVYAKAFKALLSPDDFVILEVHSEYDAEFRELAERLKILPPSAPEA